MSHLNGYKKELAILTEHMLRFEKNGTASWYWFRKLKQMLKVRAIIKSIENLKH